MLLIILIIIIIIIIIIITTTHCSTTALHCVKAVMTRCVLNYDRYVFPDGNKLPVTNLPASATGPVQRFVAFRFNHHLVLQAVCTSWLGS